MGKLLVSTLKRSLSINTKEVENHLKRSKAEFRSLTFQGSKVAARQMLKDAVHEFPKCPWKTGRLRKSGSAFVQHYLVATTENEEGMANGTPLRSGGGRIQAGRMAIVLHFNTPYANLVHANLFGRKYKYPGSGGHFLYPKIRNNWGKYVAIVQRRIDKGFGKGII